MWLIPARPFGPTVWSKEEVKADEAKCTRLGNCGYSFNAIYMGNSLVDRIWYIPFTDIERVFKRVALTTGGFSGKGMFGSMAYLTVQLKDGREKMSYFKYEDEVDTFLEYVGRGHPEIPLRSAEAERKLREAEEEEKKLYLKELTPEAEKSVKRLREAQEFLNLKPQIYQNLSSVAKHKRVIDNMNPTYKYVAIIILVASVISCIFGLISLLNGSGHALLFLLFGVSFIMFIMSSRVLPTGRNNKRIMEMEWKGAVTEMQNYLNNEENFPVPAQYAHPMVLERMIRAIRMGRATRVPEAYKILKEDYREINRDVKVSQRDYDEIVATKPMFLINDYEDEFKG